MDVDFAVTGRYVEYSFDGTLTIVGAGTRVCFSQPLSAQQSQFAGAGSPAGSPITLFLGLGLSFVKAEAAAEHTLQICVAGPDGTTVFDTGAGPLPIRSDPSAPEDLTLMFLTPLLCQFAPMAFGAHAITISIDGTPKKSLDFFVTTPPQMNAPA